MDPYKTAPTGFLKYLTSDVDFGMVKEKRNLAI